MATADPASSTASSVAKARRLRQKNIVKLHSKIERRKVEVKKTIKLLKQYKVQTVKHLERGQMDIVDRQNDVNLLIAEYKNECRNLAYEDYKDIQEFYLWAKAEIVQCSQCALENMPVEDNRGIVEAINNIIKHC
ncbi:hypothetical protein BgAZ_109510 [Babesia gibsoni]|uniref:Uncharacterized protein n=1 Tax=Babesia gibsoni TaxID=33632 RepID=A0AAD8USN1_BABGI|nr:hypothetical protein BgAZ_109510 [Babesia gibsoni]